MNQKPINNDKDNNDYHFISLFATERIEDYVALSLTLLILIIILVMS
ncbi:hypothetical protein Desca_1417 [Desulfotomaculum nigrificans CO-1-SRB]|uniref:Uncharacterized protein n=1 Tax=Desulfotomaculum nigrificans (strain DSM 14880 / VKM B-2319 / CO-1-SRB) TaxID=868595 RepID=F6B5F2_DESCC|nr:hypothetical protein [Desulfotomaculum nigrificans]AEF94273.1 hypothetical protein Desca_1417 [Desulfotomaculum nigrificans CO-1-SRB]